MDPLLDDSRTTPPPTTSVHEGGVDAKNQLKDIRLNNPKGLIVAYLNINSIRNKIESLKFLISDNIDVLIIAET